MSKTLKRLTGTSNTKSGGAKAGKITIDPDSLSKLFESLDMFKAVTRTAVHDAITQAAEDAAYDAKMREPYVTMRDCDQYMEDRESGVRMRVPNAAGAIPMRKNKDGIWEAKRAKKID